MATLQNFVYSTSIGAPAVVVGLACALSSGTAFALPLYAANDASGGSYFGTAPASLTNAWSEARRKITLYSSLADGWDGGGASRVSPAVIDRASSIISYLSKAVAVEPLVDLATDGEISFVWDDGSNMASVALLANGEIVAYSYADGEMDAYRYMSRVLNMSALEPIARVVLKMG